MNSFESIEAAKILLQNNGGIDHVRSLLEQDRMECSEALGNMIHTQAPHIDMQIYLKAGAHEIIIKSLVMRGDFERILKYCNKVNYQPNYMEILKLLIQVNPDIAVKFALKVYTTLPTLLMPML